MQKQKDEVIVFILDDGKTRDNIPLTFQHLRSQVGIQL